MTEQAQKPERPTRYKFEVFPGKNPLSKKYYFRLKAGNGEIVLQSQGYSSKDAVLDAIDRIKKNCLLARIVETTS